MIGIIRKDVRKVIIACDFISDTTCYDCLSLYDSEILAI